MLLPGWFSLSIQMELPSRSITRNSGAVPTTGASAQNNAELAFPAEWIPGCDRRTGSDGTGH